MRLRKLGQQKPAKDVRDEVLSFLNSLKYEVVANEREEPHRAALTQREKEVLRLVSLGKNNSEIARDLFISLNTVTRHMTNIFSKTGAKNRVEAAVYAVQNGIH
ncbi:MAG: response regulator transcription factor [Chloroflexi bacterium]|nr:response regulator transcription factor [Chloroflexota bacterium]